MSNPYRTEATSNRPTTPRRSLLQRVACCLAGHRWRITANNMTRFAALGHLHSMAGQDADCERCGEQWRDADPYAALDAAEVPR